MFNTFFLLILSLLFISCRTLDPLAARVMVTDKTSNDCESLGVVNVDWSWWGTSTESLNAMRNQVLEKGGNTLVQTGDETGIAYFCPDRHDLEN